MQLVVFIIAADLVPGSVHYTTLGTHFQGLISQLALPRCDCQGPQRRRRIALQ
jgi:hypothetical protein